MTADSDEELHAMADLIGLKTPLACTICKQWRYTNQYAQNAVEQESLDKNAKLVSKNLTAITIKTTDAHFYHKPNKDKPITEQPPLKHTETNVNVVEKPLKNFCVLTTSTEEEESTEESCSEKIKEDIHSIIGSEKMNIQKATECSATIATCLWDCMDIALTKNKTKWCWFQDKRTHHYDLIPSKRALAVKKGAIEELARARVRRLRAIIASENEAIDE
jgi:hypothetical protein